MEDGAEPSLESLLAGLCISAPARFGVALASFKSNYQKRVFVQLARSNPEKANAFLDDLIQDSSSGEEVFGNAACSDSHCTLYELAYRAIWTVFRSPFSPQPALLFTGGLSSLSSKDHLTIGIDVGSRTTKAVLYHAAFGMILGWGVQDSSVTHILGCEQLLASVCSRQVEHVFWFSSTKLFFWHFLVQE